MQRRNTNAGTPALTPELPAPTPALQPHQKIAQLKHQIETERRRHAKLENAFAKYLGQLETAFANSQSSLFAAREAYFQSTRLQVSPLDRPARGRQ